MATGGRMPVGRGSRRRGVWALVFCVGLLLVPAGSASPQPVDVARQVTAAQIDPVFLAPICRTIRSLQPAFAGFPAVAAVLSSLLQSFGCTGGPGPGTTTTSVVTTTTTPPQTTTTTPPPTTSTTAGTGPTTTSTSTTLPFCIPNNPVPTTVPCIPVTSTTAGTGTTTAP